MNRVRKTSRRIKPQEKKVPKEKKSLIKINEAPIRKKYISGFNKAKKDIDKIKKDWEEFEKEDQPAFSQWYNQIFGTKITELQELEKKSVELEKFLDEIELVKYQHRISFYKAYLYVKNNEGKPKQDKKEYYSGKDYDKVDEKYEKKRNRYFDEDDDEDELEEIFRQVIESNPMLKEMLRKNKSAYKMFFEKFKEDFFTRKKEEPKRDSTLKKDKGSEDELLKARYRMLVRKLHPDYRKKHDKHSEELWHEVQKAYSAKDLEKLDTLHALCDIHTGDSDGTTSISQWMSIISEYKNQLKGLKKRIKEAQKNAAWKFNKLENKEILRKSLDIQIHKSIAHRRVLISHFEKMLKSWSTPPRRRK